MDLVMAIFFGALFGLIGIGLLALAMLPLIGVFVLVRGIWRAIAAGRICRLRR